MDAAAVTGATLNRAVMVLLILAVAACTPGPERGNPLRTMAEDQANAVVQSYAQAAATLLHAELVSYATNRAPCEGRQGEISTDGRYYVSAHAQIPLAEGTHVERLTAVRDEWAGRGFEITDHRTFADGVTGVVAATNPADGVQISLESGVPPTALALLVLTPCYRSNT